MELISGFFRLFELLVHTLIINNTQRMADDAAFKLKAKDQQLVRSLLF